jgi:O-antigen biosynthesis protein
MRQRTQSSRAAADHRDVTVPTRPALCVIPTYLASAKHLDLIVRCLVSLWRTAPGTDVIVIDDGSPDRGLVAQLEVATQELGYELVLKSENTGFSKTVNVGLRRALETGRDAVLVNADIEFFEAGWLERMQARTDAQGRPAAVVGARLLYPNGLIQHAGIFVSLLKREWFHRFQYGPSDLPEALVACRCPVTGALQLIRHETLQQVGLYDEGFDMAFEDVDYCLRTFEADLDCIYEPSVRAFHHESMFRGTHTPKLEKWVKASWARMLTKWGDADVVQWIPEAL